MFFNLNRIIVIILTDKLVYDQISGSCSIKLLKIRTQYSTCQIDEFIILIIFHYLPNVSIETFKKNKNKR